MTNACVDAYVSLLVDSAGLVSAGAGTFIVRGNRFADCAILEQLIYDCCTTGL
jgi:hypothetical protein